MIPVFDSTTVPVPVTTTPDLLTRSFLIDDVTGLRHAVRRQSASAGLTGGPLDDFVVAVHELVTNAVRHGGGRGRLHLRRDGDTLVCDVVDHGGGFTDGVPLPAGPPPAVVTGGRGLLLAGVLADTLMISDGPDGVTATVTACLPTAPALVDTPDQPSEADPHDSIR